ncbi:MAG: single-stranded-DNA-specific exonuclease RecJ [Chloroflexi bacterium]|nr:single-stranded-DNA-specific exonuclease RecJ [Chloroflexota bacterium]MCI0646744.1 single-stranded-DNA-specific exonuclease RecJ [Chloroflexota bacterium]
MLYNRGLLDLAHIQAFLEGRYLESTDPFLLTDMDKAVARIKQAIVNDEMVIVYGDFDADGVTATVLLTEALRGLGLQRQQAQPYIPDRVDEGYGLNKEALTAIRGKGAGLVISVDCGIRSVQEVEHANSLGLDMIITDHHSLGQELPPAVAVINPKRPESAYPEKMLAGVGLAFKLAQALRLALPERANFDEAELLDLVALGTVADLAPLLGENRRLVIEGLKVLNTCRRPGLEALVRVAGLRPGNLTAESIAFALGPRINAAGRLAHAYDAAKLLAVNNQLMADDYARRLNQLNQERQRLTAALSRQAEEMIEPDAPLLFAADPGFLPGVVGLVASRLAEKHYRPAVVVEQGEAESRGSCRSIPEFHITEALDQVGALLERHGGHALAAGFTIKNEKLLEFKERLTEIAAVELDGRDLSPAVSVDAEVPLADVDWALQGVLGQLEPTGYANATPILMSRNAWVYSHRPVGQDSSHLQLWVGDGRVKLQAIAFRQGAWAGRLPDRVDLVYTVGVNEWNGRRNLQLMVQDIHPAG